MLNRSMISGLAVVVVIGAAAVAPTGASAYKFGQGHIKGQVLHLPPAAIGVVPKPVHIGISIPKPGQIGVSVPKPVHIGISVPPHPIMGVTVNHESPPMVWGHRRFPWTIDTPTPPAFTTSRSPTTNNSGTTTPTVYVGPKTSQYQVDDTVAPGWYDCSQVPAATPVNNYLGTSACPFYSGNPPSNYNCTAIELPPPPRSHPCFGNSCPSGPTIAMVCRQSQQPPSGGDGGSPPSGVPCPGNEQRDANGFCGRPKPQQQ